MSEVSFLGAAARNVTCSPSLNGSTSTQVDTLRQDNTKLETLSEEFRSACDDLLVGKLLGRQLPKLQRPAEAALMQCEAVSGQAKKVLQAVTAGEDQKQRLRERLAGVEDQLRKNDKLRDDLAEAQSQAKRMETLCSYRDRRFNDVNDQLREARAEVTRAKEQRDECSHSILALREELSDAKAQLKRTNITLAQNTVDLDTLTRVRGRFQHDNHTLRRELSSTATELKAANTKLAQSIFDIEALRKDRDRLQHHNEALGRQCFATGSKKKEALQELSKRQNATEGVERFWRQKVKRKAGEVAGLQAEVIALQDRVLHLEHGEYLSAHQAACVPRQLQHARALVQSIEVTVTNALEDEYSWEEFAERLREKCEDVIRLKDKADDIERFVYTVALSCKPFRRIEPTTALVDIQLDLDPHPKAQRIVDIYGVPLIDQPWAIPTNTFLERSDGRVQLQNDLSPPLTSLSSSAASPTTPSIATNLSGLMKQDHKPHFHLPLAEPHFTSCTATPGEISHAALQTSVDHERLSNMRAAERASIARPFITLPPKHPRSWDIESDRASKRRSIDSYRPRYSPGKRYKS